MPGMAEGNRSAFIPSNTMDGNIRNARTGLASRAADFRGLLGPTDSLMQISAKLGATTRDYPREAANKSAHVFRAS